MKNFDDLFAELTQKAADRPAGSGTVEALDKGEHFIGKKIVEEAAEVWMAAEYQSREELAEEIKVSSRATAPDADPTPVWYQVIMFGLIVIGLAWLILWYLLDFSYPIPGIGYWNVGIGIGLMMVGLLMTTRWR